MAQQMTMFKSVNASFTSARPSARAERRAMMVRAGAYDAELVETAVRLRAECCGGALGFIQMRDGVWKLP